MDNNNQTPVEWFYDKVIQKQYKDIDDSLEDLHEQAKEMESQKDAKYNEMLEMLIKLRGELTAVTPEKIHDELEQLIKEATQI
jgi:membrane-associated HD superfamily phosphohydrolase